MNRTIPSLAGLNEGLRVRHIAAFPLLTCSAADDLREVLSRRDLDGIDQIPITDGGRIVALWEHTREWRRRPLDDSVLVSADAPLWHFIHTVHEQPYRLVVEQTGITGIVTWSDLLKVPVLVLAFSLMVELELAMNRRILEQYTDDTWVELLDRDERQKIRGRRRKLERENLTLPMIELADLWHKAKLLRGTLGADRDFEAELGKVVKLRNDVDHVKDIVRSDADLKGFVEHLETAEAWLNLVKSPEPMAATVGS
ncbi:MAG: CBS domain-containing protein [Candidatus Sulfotelmatobacter sp.]|jgi:hypothetical protein